MLKTPHLPRIALLLLMLLLATAGKTQQTGYAATLQKAVSHRHSQNAAHGILWNPDLYLLQWDSFELNREEGLLTAVSLGHRVRYRIKILGTYDHKDSSFLWSTHDPGIPQAVSAPVSRMMQAAAAWQWEVAQTSRIRCSFDSAWQLATLAFYLDSANGIEQWISKNNTVLFFSYYEVEVYDAATGKLLRKIPARQQYQPVQAPDAIRFCSSYVAEFGANERKFKALPESLQEAEHHLDTLFRNRKAIFNRYWNTGSKHLARVKAEPLHPLDLQQTNNWRAITVNGTTYVLFEERIPWGGWQTWAFQICPGKEGPRICNELLSF